MPLSLQLLHTPALRLDDGLTLPLPPNDAALLAVLAIDGPTSREAMAELLWPDAPGEGARVNLRQRLSRWKTRAGLVLQVPGAGNMLALPHPPAAADAEPGRVTLSHDLQGLVQRLQADPAAGSGELLGSFTYGDNPRLALWLQRARERWRGARLDELAVIAERLEREHGIAEALPYASRIAQEDPLAEHAHRRVMRLHYLRSDRSAALAAYDRLRTLLRDELGTIPSQETLALARLIESSGAIGLDLPGSPVLPPLALLRPPRMVGREAEWRVLAHAWRAARPVLLVGDAGIGKSRLVGEFAEAQGHPMLARARLGDAREPYSTLARLLREAFARFAAVAGPAADMPAWTRTELARLAPELAVDSHDHAGWGSASPGRLEPPRLRHALTVALGHWHSLGARSLVVDDVQFADAASLELLLAWHRDASDTDAGRDRPADEPLRLLLTARSNEVPPAVALWQAEQAANSAHPPVDLRLGPLNGGAVAELIESLALAELDAPHWAGPVHRHTGGNPLFIVQTLITALNGRLGLLQDRGVRPAPAMLPLPDQVAVLIDQRLKQLSSDALRLARLAAIAGPNFNAELAARVLQTHPINLADPWAELENHGVLGEHGFAHDLLCEVTLRSVPRPIAQALHRRVAEALTGQGVAAARLADHWLQAGHWREASEAFSAAAAVANAASRRAEELVFLDEAAVCLERAGDRAAAYQAQLRALDAAVVVDPGAAVTHRMQVLFAEARTDTELLDAWLAQSKQLLNDAAFAAAREPARQAMALALDQADPVRRVAAAGWHGLAMVLCGEEGAGLAVFESVSVEAAHLTQSTLRPAHRQVALDYFGAHGYALHHVSRFEAALAPMRRATALALELGDINEAMVQAINVGMVLHRLGDRSATLAALEEALVYWRQLDEPTGVNAAALHMYVGELHADAGRYRAALTALVWSLEQVRAGRAAAWVTRIEHRLSALFVALGQPAKARQTLTPLPSDASASDHLARLMAICRLTVSKEGAAAKELAAFAACFPDDVPALNRLNAHLLIADRSPPERAIQLCRDVRAQALALDAQGVALHALIRHADALRRQGDAAGAAALAEAAIAEIGDCSEHGFHGLQRGEFWWLSFIALDAGGLHAAAQHALSTGAVAIQRIARDHTPAEFVDSFLNRNPFNCDLLNAAKNRLAS